LKITVKNDKNFSGIEVTQLEFPHLKNEPQRAQSSRKERKVLKYIFALLCGNLCDLCGKIKNEFQLRNS